MYNLATLYQFILRLHGKLIVKSTQTQYPKKYKMSQYPAGPHLFLAFRRNSTGNQSAIHARPPFASGPLPGLIALSRAIRFTVAQRRDRHRIALRRVTRAFRRTGRESRRKTPARAQGGSY